MYVLDLRGHYQQISFQVQASLSQSQDISSQANSSSSPRYSIRSTASTSTSVDATDQDPLLLPNKDMFPVTPTVDVTEQVLSASPNDVSMYQFNSSIVIYCHNIYNYLFTTCTCINYDIIVDMYVMTLVT